MAKKIAQFALPHTTAYTLVDSYHTGSLLDGGGTSCQNCGKTITNVGVVQNEAGEKFSVGMDCASTLSGLNPFDLDTHQHRFQLAKSLVAKIRKYVAKNAATTVQAYISQHDKQVRVVGTLGTSRLFTESYLLADFEQVIIKAGAGVVPGLTPSPEPVYTVYGTEPSPFKTGDSVGYVNLKTGEPGTARVLWLRDNTEYPGSAFRQSAMLTGTQGVYDVASLTSI